MAKSVGEEYYSSRFVLSKNIDIEFHTVLRDYLYKFAFNLAEAYEYLFLLDACMDIEESHRSGLIERIYVMSVQCLALSLRKITDNSSKRSIRRINSILPNSPVVRFYQQEIEPLYKRYNRFLDKFVVHQDGESINDALTFLPERGTFISDLELLREYYISLARETCTSYIDLNGEGTYFGLQLQKLAD